MSNQQNYAFTREVAIRKLQKVMCALTVHGPMTKEQVAEKVGVVPRTASAYLTKLHADGKVHIHAWVRKGESGGEHTRLWASGRGKDAAKPPRQTYEQVYAKQMSNPERAMRILMKQRARRTKPKRDRLMSALFPIHNQPKETHNAEST